MRPYYHSELDTNQRRRRPAARRPIIAALALKYSTSTTFSEKHGEDSLANVAVR